MNYLSPAYIFPLVPITQILNFRTNIVFTDIFKTSHVMPLLKETSLYISNDGMTKLQTRVCIHVQVPIYCRLLIGRDGHLDRSEACDIS